MKSRKQHESTMCCANEKDPAFPKRFLLPRLARAQADWIRVSNAVSFRKFVAGILNALVVCVFERNDVDFR